MQLKPFEILGIGLGAYFLFRHIGTNVNNNVSFGKPRISYGGFNGAVLNIDLKLPVANANPFPINVHGFVGNLFYGKTKIADLFIPQMQSVQPMSEGNIIVDALIVPNQLINNLAQLITDFQPGFLRINGRANINDFIVNIDREVYLL